jgi:hypothetical protein
MALSLPAGTPLVCLVHLVCLVYFVRNLCAVAFFTFPEACCLTPEASGLQGRII